MRDDMLEAFRERLVDTFETIELFDYLEISVTELLDAFPEKWENNKALMKAVGFDYSRFTDDGDYDAYGDDDDERD